MDPFLEALLEFVLSDLGRVGLAATAATHVVAATAETPATGYKRSDNRV